MFWAPNLLIDNWLFDLWLCNKFFERNFRIQIEHLSEAQRKIINWNLIQGAGNKIEGN